MDSKTFSIKPYFIYAGILCFIAFLLFKIGRG